MANNKKNVKRLVSDDDDPTAELEALTLPDESASRNRESATSTAGFSGRPAAEAGQTDSVASLKTDLLSRSETIDRLQFDMEVLRAKWQGLSTEIKAREEHANKLNVELKTAKQAAQDAEERIADSKKTTSDLQLQLQQRDEAYRKLTVELAILREQISAGTPDDERLNERLLIIQSGQLASGEHEIRELQTRVQKSEEYADQIRYQLRLRDADAGDFNGTIEALEQRLKESSDRVSVLQKELHQAQNENSKLTDNLSQLHNTHAEEIRMIRFELGDAQETLTQHELVAEQLASDLVETRTHRTELENMLAESEESSNSTIDSLQKENRRLLFEVENMTDKLQTKSEAINCLLAELAKHSTAPDPVTDIEDAIEEIDTRMSEQIDDRSYIERERVTRLLIGKIDGQELRFPLFKDRLTMGRTRQNDIQLKSEHISRRHAVVVIEGDVTRVIDWGSKNGVFVNSKKVKEHFLKNGDLVGVGTAEFRYEERPKRDS
ncbi:MAG: FHA domain-containing protein [Woeseiaceae bacterium]